MHVEILVLPPRNLRSSPPCTRPLTSPRVAAPALARGAEPPLGGQRDEAVCAGQGGAGHRHGECLRSLLAPCLLLLPFRVRFGGTMARAVTQTRQRASWPRVLIVHDRRPLDDRVDVEKARRCVGAHFHTSGSRVLRARFLNRLHNCVLHSSHQLPSFLYSSSMNSPIAADRRQARGPVQGGHRRHGAGAAAL
jgi:hypothetical protein